MVGGSPVRLYRVKVEGVVLVPLPPNFDEALIYEHARGRADDGYIKVERLTIVGEATEAEARAWRTRT